MYGRSIIVHDTDLWQTDRQTGSGALVIKSNANVNMHNLLETAIHVYQIVSSTITFYCVLCN